MRVVLRNRLVNRRTFTQVGASVFLFLAILVALPVAHYSKETLTRTGLPAADFAVTDLNGNLVRLSSLRGKCVLLDFWATGCWPCREDTPNIRALHERYKGDLVVIGVTCDTRRKSVEEYVVKEKIEWTQILDSIDHGGELFDLYGVTYMPTYVLIDRDGLVARTGPGTDDHLLENSLDRPRTLLENLVLRVYRSIDGAT